MNAKEQITIELAQKGIVGSGVEVEVDKIVAAIPEATRNMYPEDKYEAAMKFWPVYNSQSGAPANPAVPQTPTATEAAPAALSAQQAKAIQSVMAKDKAVREERTAKTTVEKLLIDKPAPASYLDSGMTIIPTCKPEKLKEYEDALVEDEANKQAFNQLKDAVINKKPMPIYISKGASKIMGYIINTPSGEAGNDSMVRKPMTSDRMLSFVTTDLMGYIPTRGDGVGVRLMWRTPKPGTKAYSKRATGTPLLRVYHKQEALQSPEGHEIISMVEKNGDQVVTQPGKLRTSLSFKIYTGEVGDDGVKRTRTIRFSGDANVPKFVRTTEEYAKMFGRANKDRNTFAAPDAKELADLERAAINTVNYMMSNPGYDIDSFKRAYDAATMASNPNNGLDV